MSKNYLNNDSFTYQIILSQGKGYLTDPSKKMIVELIKRVQSKIHYNDMDLKYDVYMESVLHVIDKGWKAYDYKRYPDSCFTFFSEISKRALAAGYHKMFSKKSYDTNNYKFISLTSYIDNSSY